MTERTATLDDTDLAAMLSTPAGKLDKVAALSRHHAQGLIIGWATATHAEELADILHHAEQLVRVSRVRLCGRTIESVLKECPTHG